jgi:hypothetical protein
VKRANSAYSICWNDGKIPFKIAGVYIYYDNSDLDYNNVVTGATKLIKKEYKVDIVHITGFSRLH